MIFGPEEMRCQRKSPFDWRRRPSGENCQPVDKCPAPADLPVSLPSLRVSSLRGRIKKRGECKCYGMYVYICMFLFVCMYVCRRRRSTNLSATEPFFRVRFRMAMCVPFCIFRIRWKRLIFYLKLIFNVMDFNVINNKNFEYILSIIIKIHIFDGWRLFQW